MRAPKIVGVIFSRADLERAVRMRKPPDFFELRLDRLIKSAIGPLPAPLIITARDPREGGANNLSAVRRRALLLKFLPRAAYVDVELRSARAFRSVLESASENKVRAILSFHDFEATPADARLDEIALEARSLGAAIVKVATRTDTRAQSCAAQNCAAEDRAAATPAQRHGIRRFDTNGSIKTRACHSGTGAQTTTGPRRDTPYRLARSRRRNQARHTRRAVGRTRPRQY